MTADASPATVTIHGNGGRKVNKQRQWASGTLHTPIRPKGNRDNENKIDVGTTSTGTSTNYDAKRITGNVGSNGETIHRDGGREGIN